MKNVHAILLAGRRGFTLIESVVVIAILSILALVGVNTISEFQRNAILSSATQELGSTLRMAKANSTSGLVKIGEVYTETGYPYYGINLLYDSACSCYIYNLTRTFTKVGFSQITENLEPLPHKIDSSITVSPVSLNITFDRITGIPSSTLTITLTRSDSTTSKTITVNSNGLISL